MCFCFSPYHVPLHLQSLSWLFLHQPSLVLQRRLDFQNFPAMSESDDDARPGRGKILQRQKREMKAWHRLHLKIFEDWVSRTQYVTAKEEKSNSNAELTLTCFLEVAQIIQKQTYWLFGVSFHYVARCRPHAAGLAGTKEGRSRPPMIACLCVHQRFLVNNWKNKCSQEITLLFTI